MKIEINDRLYGETTFEEPVLIELLNSRAMQRLKGISQFGLPKEFCPFPGFSRYEHSVGVAILLKKLKAGLEEQVAGLTHDVSHPAFSHLVDWVLGNREKEDHQDRNHKKIVSSSDIPEILNRHGFEPERIIDVKKYGLLEREAPDLCADRVDYAIREFKTWAAPSIVGDCLDNLVNHNGRIEFYTADSAINFAFAYAKCQREHWGGAECTVRWEIFSQALKTALKNGIIKEDDFYMEDEQILRKLRVNGNVEIGIALEMLDRKRLKLRENSENPQYKLKKKFRYIDPAYINKREVHKLSGLKSYRAFLDEQRAINEKGVNVDIVF